MNSDWPIVSRCVCKLLVAVTVVYNVGQLMAATPPVFTVENHRDRIQFLWMHDREPVSMGKFVFEDETIRRPYFANLRLSAPATQITRNHPPQQGDSEDHATMHPGVWFAFGDLNGHDFWRNKGRVVHEKFLVQPDGVGYLDRWSSDFTSVLRYESADSKPIARETFKCRLSVLDAPGVSWALDWDSTFEQVDAPLVFGDQEEMGLGVRLATNLTAKQGGTIENSEGRTTEKEVWGRAADWCLYANKGQGVLLLAHPDNFKKSTFHVRDYGLLVANPFAEQAFGRSKQPAQTVVKPGEKLRLRYRLVLLSDAESAKFDPAALFQSYAADKTK